MASDADRFRSLPLCAIHRTFRKKFNRPTVIPEKVVKTSSSVVTPPQKSE